jgi:hypothetical protein
MVHWRILYLQKVFILKEENTKMDRNEESKHHSIQLKKLRRMEKLVLIIVG